MCDLKRKKKNIKKNHPLTGGPGWCTGGDKSQRCFVF